MRHRKKSERFSRSRAQKKALVKSLLRALIIHEQITTTTSKAKYLRGESDRLITLAKKNTLAGRRQAYRLLESHSLVKRLFDAIGPRFKDISGGYTRALLLGKRKGDGASLSRLELTKLVKKATKLKDKKGKAAESEPKAKEAKTSHKKERQQKKGIMSGVRKIFKKDHGGSK